MKESFYEKIRLQIFNKFWASADKVLQSLQISTLVTKNQKKSSRKRNKPTVKNREYPKAYTLLINGDSVPVCAKMFHSTLGIDEKNMDSHENYDQDWSASKREKRLTQKL